MTFRRALVAAAARSATIEGWQVTSANLNDWVNKSKTAKCIGADFGAFGEDDLAALVDRLSWPRLVSAVGREVSSESERAGWLNALRGVSRVAAPR